MRNNIILILTLTVLTSCVKEPQDEMGNNALHHGTEAFAGTLNKNIQALNTIAQAYTSGHGIKACIPYEAADGFAILFTDGRSASFSTVPSVLGNGSVTPATSPMVGISMEDNDIVWTIDGKSTGKHAYGPSECPAFTATKEGLELRFGDKLIDSYAFTDLTLASFFKTVTQEDEKYTIEFHNNVSLDFSASASETVPPVQGTGAIRRPVSPQQPMWLIHIDTWLHPDPQKIIDMIPSDILPYVVFNLSLSVEGSSTGKWTKVEYGYETARSWLRTCAMNQVWAMIQPASGAYCHFKDTESYDEAAESLYAEFYREYPNFIGFNYCEQFWGFGEEYSVSYGQRLKHWANLMRLTHEYGGYLIISCCGPYYAASMNPVAMVKNGGEFTEMCRAYPENLIICEKFTSKYGFYNNESACLGMWLSGFAGQYGIRFDTCGWNETADNVKCPRGAEISALFEHIMLTGETVIDGPELIWEECYKEVSAVKTDDGYTSRRWEAFPQFGNISIDLFRKIIDGTIRIPSRKEVIERSGLILIHDINSGTDRQKYTAPEGLYEGLYQTEGDGDMLDNRTWLKKSGRYPSIPYAAELNDAQAQTFRTIMNMSDYGTAWGDIESKVEVLNNMFPEEYSGDIFAGRHENAWVTYNPYREIRRAEGTLSLKLNSCSSLTVSHPNFSAAVIKESADDINVYLNNYDPHDNSLKTDEFTVHGAVQEPSVSFTDRGDHPSSDVQTTWEDGIFTIQVSHNGPLDLTIRCTGTDTGKSLSVTSAPVSVPQSPDVYKGEYQFEAENFDYKNIASIIKNGCSGSVRNYTGQGYMDFGQKSGASARISFNQKQMAQCSIGIKYMAPDSDIASLSVYINGKSAFQPILTRTSDGEWNICHQFIELKTGTNTIEIRAEDQSESRLLIDNIVLTPISAQ
ncbi:MAG: glycosyl hydrolase family 98 [Bacteroidales bacterium]|nr:glycosyl hydrolase family 98 [Bacteroidales bacterium]